MTAPAANAAPTPRSLSPRRARGWRRRSGVAPGTPAALPPVGRLPGVRTAAHPEVSVVVVEHGPVSPTSLPALEALVARDGGRVRVALDGEHTEVLRRRLAADWAVTDDADPLLDLAVVRGSDPDRVRRLCSSHPGLAVLALVPDGAPPELAVSMLTAGADGCLRGADPDEVNAHLRAMSRRVARRTDLLAV